ncbi:Pr6Pr family membrane protein [Mucilaginibacter sp. JRF]|uniref:Pr6Pr family membrane protein n=1 Tax=Mucilaginibacter sp. JRF TaxID=2780088 RepID=UPI0018830E49|nr:Pr6Pr family membrane protein [Mucilaginibacter sp. JRF]MBE9584858.1 Pr6Pr family membrane protein [Mucilaginibacter sp. JRF]
MESTSIPKKSTAKKVFALVTAAFAWAAVIVQYCIGNASVVNFLSYFTILCNLLVAVCLTFSTLMPGRRVGKLFSGLSAQSAIAVYVFIVGLVYNTVLRGIWAPTGMAWLVDNTLHVVVPVLYLLYWALYRPHGALQWQSGFYWAVFPLLYLVYSLVHGAMVHWYPYPFIDADKLAYTRVFINAVVVTSAFVITGLIIVLITRSGKRSL